MARLRKTPLAWKNLTHDWRRLAVAVAGIGFAVLLMFTQVGFQNALFDSQVKLIDDLQGDIFLVSRAKYALAAEKRFPRELINQARACPGVAGAYPLYTELTLSRLKNLAQGSSRKAYPIRTIGFHLEDPVFNSPAINAQRLALRGPQSSLVALRSTRSNFDFPLDDPARLAATPVELANQRLRLAGVFEMGTDFAHDGNLAMSAENFAKYFPQRVAAGDPLSVVDLGIVHVNTGASAGEVRDLLDQILDDRVLVLTREQFRLQEVKFWDDSTPIGIIFNAGKIIGFVVGMVICYQVIYSDIADHMPEFATLKAMGYSTGYFLRLIVVEAVLLSLIGFVPGLAVSSALYAILARATGLLLTMTAPSMALVLVLTIAMCIASGLLAVRKLLGADPANLF
ncbi:MAG: FtsX-like permease family protein [Pirellulales bacterium]|nr:FtsX-like permease family protein [Pirellulales bacterium]